MNNEVRKLFDDLFIDFIEERGIQLWPEWKRTKQGFGTVVEVGDPEKWTVSSSKPFKQVTRPSLKAALTALAMELGDVRFKK